MVNKGLQMFMDFKARSNPAVLTICNSCFPPITALLKETKLLLKFILFLLKRTASHIEILRHYLSSLFSCVLFYV